MYVLLVYLHSSPKEQRPLVAVLLLHLDLLVRSYSLQRFLNYDLGSLCFCLFPCLLFGFQPENFDLVNMNLENNTSLKINVYIVEGL